MKAFLLLVFIASNQAIVSGPYEQQECEQQAEMVRGPTTSRTLSFGYPRQKGEVECVRDGSFQAPVLRFDHMPTDPMPGVPSFPVFNCNGNQCSFTTPNAR